MRCQTCGEELREGARFCPTCGSPTQPGAASTPTTVQIRRPSSEQAPPPTEQEPAASPPPDQSSPEVVAEPGAETVVVQPAASPPRADREPAAVRDPGVGYDPVGPPRVAPPPGTRASTNTPPRPAGAPARGFTPPTGADFSTLMQRLLRLLRLDTKVFADLYADASATVPALVFAAAVLIVSGLGGMLYIAGVVGFDEYDAFGGTGTGEFFIRSVVLGTVFALLMLAAWSAITMLVLRQIAGVDANFYGLLRVLCVALAPLVLSLLLFFDDGFDALGWIALGGVASLALLGVLEAVEVRPGPAWLATMAGFAVFVIVLTFLGHSNRDYAPGFFIGGLDITIDLDFDFNDLPGIGR